MVTCWERANLLALVCGVLLWVCHFPIGILGQVWYLIVSIPDLCTLTYFDETVLFFKFPAGWPQEYTELEKVIYESGNNTELTETYRSCLDKGELLVCKINHDQVWTEQNIGVM